VISALLPLAPFVAGVLAAAVLDVASFTIPNRLTAALAILFLPAALFAHLPLGVISACLLTGAAALAIGVGLFAAGLCGGGDAKLIAACALWLSWQAMVPFLLVTSLTGGLLGIAVILARRTMPEAAVAAGPAWLGRLLGPQKHLPYGVAIAAGALAAISSSPFVALLKHP
jgi:prepilin peptidase CpaA